MLKGQLSVREGNAKKYSVHLDKIQGMHDKMAACYDPRSEQVASWMVDGETVN